MGIVSIRGLKSGVSTNTDDEYISFFDCGGVFSDASFPRANSGTSILLVFNSNLNACFACGQILFH